MLSYITDPEVVTRGADGSFKDWTIYEETGPSPGEVELSISEAFPRRISGYYLVSLQCVQQHWNLLNMKKKISCVCWFR